MLVLCPLNPPNSLNLNNVSLFLLFLTRPEWKIKKRTKPMIADLIIVCARFLCTACTMQSDVRPEQIFSFPVPLDYEKNESEVRFGSLTSAQETFGHFLFLQQFGLPPSFKGLLNLFKSVLVSLILTGPVYKLVKDQPNQSLTRELLLSSGCCNTAKNI